jgi:hypothetical protein
MKTECHCLYCPKHPLHAERGKKQSPTGFDPTRFVMSSGTGVVVNCLKPISKAFDEFDIDPKLEKFPVTAYGDGASMTGFERDGITLYATCGNEKYVAPPSKNS